MKKTDADTQTMQDLFLNRARQLKMPLTVFLINGFQMRGTVSGFDPYTVVLDTDGKQQMIYKHAISTLVPARPLPLWAEDAAQA